ncbi:MAG: glycosyltransferase family 9 protein [Phycisphaerae bacterium]
MQIVKARDDATVYGSGGQLAFSLRGGQKYLLYDQEAGLGLRDGALDLAGGLERRLPSYRRQPLRSERLLLPFIGRNGDAIAAASCLAALVEAHPGITVDVACTSDARAVWELMPRFGELLTYPVEADLLERYAYHLSFEEVEAVPRGAKRSCAEVFSLCLCTPRPTRPASVTVPTNARARWTLPDSPYPRVGVHVGACHSLRSYPHDLMAILIDELSAQGMEVYLFGTGDSRAGTAPRLPAAAHDLAGKTTTPADLAAVLAQMHVVVTGDSFPLHLAGALGVFTLALFTSTDAAIADDYPSVTALRSDARCSPCGLTDGVCPLGHGECIAHRAASLSPELVVERVGQATSVRPVSTAGQ